jgi:hypothetical protein
MLNEEPPDWGYWSLMIALIQFTLDLITRIHTH